MAVGENFRFGHRAQGDVELLRADGRFEIHVEPLLEVDGEVVSLQPHPRSGRSAAPSSTPAACSARPFALSGEVVHGDKRGRELGFPTANLVPPDGYVVPGHGVYAGGAPTAMPGRASTSACGPQFETGRGELIEAFLIDWEGDLYGSRLRIEFLKRLRGERRFASVDALVEQMGRDVEAAARSVTRLTATLRRRMTTLTPERTREIVAQVRRQRRRHRQHARPDRSAHRAHQRRSPSTCARTRRITTRAAGC